MDVLGLDWKAIVATVGPFGAVVIVMLWRCIQRQDAREDRMTEVITQNAVAMEGLHDRVNEAYRLAHENNRLLLGNGAAKASSGASDPSR